MTTALLIVDVQHALLPFVRERPSLLRRLSVLITRAQAAGTLVVATVQSSASGSPRWSGCGRSVSAREDRHDWPGWPSTRTGLRVRCARFDDVVGVPPEVAAQISRCERLHAEPERGGPGELAARLGVSGQSHLAREVRRPAGGTPPALTRARRPTEFTVLRTHAPSADPSARNHELGPVRPAVPFFPVLTRRPIL